MTEEEEEKKRAEAVRHVNLAQALYMAYLLEADKNLRLQNIIEQCMSPENKAEVFQLTWIAAAAWMLVKQKEGNKILEIIGKEIEKEAKEQEEKNKQN